MSDTNAVEVLAPGPLPAGLMDAFWAYDRALLGNDVPALDSSFARGADTLRADGSGVVVGHRAISEFRAARTAIPNRRVVRVHVRLPADGVALIVAEVVSPAGAPGLQTQLWQRGADGWRVGVAHVTAPARPLDGTVWRVLGAPLVPGRDAGPLRGLTFAVKDLFAVAGHAVGAGVAGYLAQARVRTEHAHAVGVLLEAGASIAGIAQTDEFAYSVHGRGGRQGTPDNPAAPGRLPGGSTSGPAVAVARGEVAFGLGTDTAGSIRVPGSYQGLWGIRTTTGAIGTEGLLPLAPSFDTVGWLAGDGGTLLAVAEALLPEDARTGHAEPAGHAELVTVPALNSQADREIAEAVAGTADALGATALEVAWDLDSWYAAFRTVQGWEAWRAHGAWIAANPGALSADVAARFDRAARITDEEHASARRELADASEAIRTAVQDRFLLLPATPTGPPPAAGIGPEALAVIRDRTLRLTCLASLAGLPALTVPAAKPAGMPTGMPLGRASGLPVGLGLVGPPGSDRALIRFALSATATAAGRSPHAQEEHP
ncbi:AtzH-like domain-containing protein [Streptomyces sp. NBRC 109706]|uniref:AtzH-like domain-containing protein n=1 Tax=Streptomyces sp. NBRC 109706 TaxID=1550035 RepID=UPI000829A4A5|nr:AtzH-like domain-containing protein [Streptomyces sp. NBRC 109706]